ncbi:aldehyde ferredoxin oxidoreductase family protein [Halobellus limi]|uniref:Aldehyde ferredoxin oxidoreductase n=1 Tax=Halobellus limi TaxID=699433 RepID=A0A1H6CUL7_9EURY|nr:aldehyde ferredoxin oxidoreductase C-terminal domain-containing protein [Halobellus limi]QCC49139.1 aldehyde ferredoxin oxidoreductase [Halobellus limi]SEG76373.1 aldehyde:ferredoxin oxidoreductase [Halobellus limi]
MTDGAPTDLLHVDLSAGSVERERLPDRWLAEYVGGKGLGARYLYDRLEPGTDPLGPANYLLFTLGPLSGLLPGEPQFAAITRSPLTGTFLDSYSGGEFASSLVGALGGALGVAITGQADEPTVLEIADGTATLSPADDLWGRDVVETCDAFEGAVACAGPAGENRVRYATIASDGGDHHAGRGGAGAVMGAKRLKAVVARGSQPEPSREVAALRDEYERRYREHDVGRWHAASATLETVDFADEVGVLSTRGWQEGSFDGAADIGIDAVREAAVAREADGDSEIPGGFRVETEAGESVPRGATPMSLGAGLGIDDFDAVAALGQDCDRLGIDVISAGNAVAWTVRAVEAGIVDVPDAPDALGSTPDFGDEEAARGLIDAIAHREDGVPDALADGVEAAAERLGGADLVPTIKSMELPAYDPRGSPTMALAYATSDRGACHRRSLPAETEVFEGDSWDDTDRVRLVIREQTITSVLWSLIADDFAGAVLEDDLGAEWLSTVDATAPTDPAELLRVGERTWTLTRLFNVREGFDASDETLPSVFERPLAGGPASGDAIDTDWFDGLRRRYYAARGWNEEGIPTRDLLDRLDLLDVVDDDTPVAGRDSIARRSD